MEENVFKKIGRPLLDVPEDLRDRVIADVENARLLMDIAELFSLKYGSAASHIFERIRNQNIE